MRREHEQHPRGPERPEAASEAIDAGASGDSGAVGELAADGPRARLGELSGEHRVGWLLATSRHLAGRDLARGDVFVDALTAVGVRATPAQVHAWEDGSLRPGRADIAGYEQALGLPPLRLASVVDCLRLLADDPDSWATWDAAVPPAPASAERRAELTAAVFAGHAVPTQHLELVRALAADPDAAASLTEEDWATLTERVTWLLPRCVKVGYTQQISAVMTLASLAPAQEPLVDAVRRYLAVPDVQVTLNPLGLLDKVPTRSSAALVLDLLERPPSPAVERLCVWLAAQKLQRGDLVEAERDRLDYIVLSAWRRDAARTSRDMAELIAVLPPGLRATLTNAARMDGSDRLGHVVATGWERASPHHDDLLRRGVRSALEAVFGDGAPHDPVLARLVREALLHRDSERRHVASVTLAGSAFAHVVGAQVLHAMKREPLDDLLRHRCAVLVRYVVQTAHRTRVVAMTADRDERVAVPLLQALGHLPRAADSDLQLRAAVRPEENDRERARLYALGMSGSPVLETLASGDGPAWQRGAARWWLEMGPAVFG